MHGKVLVLCACLQDLHVPQSTLLCDWKHHHVQRLEAMTSLVRAAVIMSSPVFVGEAEMQQPAVYTAVAFW